MYSHAGGVFFWGLDGWGGEVDGWTGVGFSLLFSICPPAVAE